MRLLEKIIWLITVLMFQNLILKIFSFIMTLTVEWNKKCDDFVRHLNVSIELNAEHILMALCAAWQLHRFVWSVVGTFNVRLVFLFIVHIIVRIH